MGNPVTVNRPASSVNTVRLNGPSVTVTVSRAFDRLRRLFVGDDRAGKSGRLRRLAVVARLFAVADVSVGARVQRTWEGGGGQHRRDAGT